MASLFSNTSNIDLLWELTIDQFHLQKNDSFLQNIRFIFESNLSLFNPHVSTSVLELNKLFLSQIITAINKLFPNLKNMKRINISGEEEKITVENMASLVEEKLIQRQNDIPLKKKVTFNEDNEIFEKLNKIDISLNEITDLSNYDEQHSLSLADFEKSNAQPLADFEKSNATNYSQSSNTSKKKNNEPLFTFTELLHKINNLESKMDQIIAKLT
jgi:hypothetical protein